MAEVMEDERVRAERLLAAQAKAELLFAALDERGVIAAGVRENAASDAIADLSTDLFGTDSPFGGDSLFGADGRGRRRVVRAGPNTLLPLQERRTVTKSATRPEFRRRREDRAPVDQNDRVIQNDDIVVCDVDGGYGRTFVVGDDPVKQRLRDALPRIFDVGRRYFDQHPEVTGEQLHATIRGLAAQAGWSLGGSHAGHLVGEPHPVGEPTGQADRIESYIAPGNHRPLHGPDRAGRPRHWILQIHLIDTQRRIGGFHEELLDLHR